MRRTRPAAAAAVALVATLGLTACGSGAGGAAPTWVPSPDFGTNGEGPGVRLTPIVPQPSPSQPGSSSAPGSGSAPSPGKSSGVDPDVVAKRLTTPTGVAVLPDNTALVGERTTGRIVRVQPKAGQPVPTVRTLHGLDTGGGGGLLDLALSPTYGEDNLIYAYITTPKDNRVVDFTLHGPVTPVLTGIPKGRSDNTGRLAFGGDGQLYVGTGDAGVAAHAATAGNLAGKVLRVNGIGRPATGDPTPGSPVWTSGHRVVNGLCAIPQSNAVLETETGAPGRDDEINALAGGDYYGWPRAAGTIDDPISTLPDNARAPGGCAVLNSTLYLASLDGTELLSAPLTTKGAAVSLGKFGEQLRGRYGRLLTVVAAGDGALWLTTSNRDGRGKPVRDDERVIRYVPTAGGSSTNPA